MIRIEKKMVGSCDDIWHITHPSCELWVRMNAKESVIPLTMKYHAVEANQLIGWIQPRVFVEKADDDFTVEQLKNVLERTNSYIHGPDLFQFLVLLDGSSAPTTTLYFDDNKEEKPKPRKRVVSNKRNTLLIPGWPYSTLWSLSRIEKDESIRWTTKHTKQENCAYCAAIAPNKRSAARYKKWVHEGCKDCKLVQYCSRTHQKYDHSSHTLLCEAWRNRIV